MGGLLVFDLDNTIVHSRIDFAGIRRDLISLLRERGVADGAQEDLSRLSIGQIIDVGEARDQRIGREAWQIVLEYETSGMSAAEIDDRADEALRTLKGGGFLLAILTNNARAATTAALEKFDIAERFDLVLTRDEVAMKPDPEGLHVARSRFDGSAARCAMIGDSWLDGTAAQRAGVPFIAFRPRPGVMEERRVSVWATVERLDQIPPIVSVKWPSH